MLKFAIAAGITYEWVEGAAVTALPALGVACLHAVCAIMLAWIVLEAGHTLYRAAMSLESRPRR
jgi:hypothetical protein